MSFAWTGNERYITRDLEQAMWWDAYCHLLHGKITPASAVEAADAAIESFLWKWNLIREHDLPDDERVAAEKKRLGPVAAGSRA
jgi:hypothetical protein